MISIKSNYSPTWCKYDQLRALAEYLVGYIVKESTTL